MDTGARERRIAVARAVAITVVAAIFAGVGASADGDPGPWPDSRVAALWPTFSAVPAAETGAGGRPRWDGAFRGCVRSSMASFSFACEYVDEQGRLGYACVAASAPRTPISPASVDARVAPGDPTYAAEPPTHVCYSALAYSLSLG